MCAHTRKAVHNTGCLPIEAVVRYPFHPFAGQLVPIVGHIEHAGTRHLIIRTADKSGFLLPSWMTAPEAGAIQIVAGPRLPLNRIIELRALSTDSWRHPPGNWSPPEDSAMRRMSPQQNLFEPTLARSELPLSKRGNRYLRVLFVQAAWVVLIRPQSWERYGLKPWIEAAKPRLHHNVLAIALANKLARIAWAVLNKGGNFECARTNAMTPRSA